MGHALQQHSIKDNINYFVRYSFPDGRSEIDELKHLPKDKRLINVPKGADRFQIFSMWSNEPKLPERKSPTFYYPVGSVKYSIEQIKELAENEGGLVELLRTMEHDRCEAAVKTVGDRYFPLYISDRVLEKRR